VLRSALRQIGQRRMMLDAGDLAAQRQQIFEVAAPAGGVLSLAVAARRSPVQYRFDSTAQAAGGFRPARPNRLDGLEDERRIDRLNRGGAENRADIGAD
jgi:hypothetical protein